MEVISGKQTLQWDMAKFKRWLAGYAPVLVDLGTGDGRFVRAAALVQPQGFAIGLDACRENLRATARKLPSNALFVIANAIALPEELRGVATRLTINFPWGSLLDGLLQGEPGLLNGLAALCRAGAKVEVRLNGEALGKGGFSLEAGGVQVRQSLAQAGFMMHPPQVIDARALRVIPATWAKRLAFGRDPCGMVVYGYIVG